MSRIQPPSAQGLYRGAALSWAALLAWSVVGPDSPEVSRVLLALVITVSVAALVRERDERMQETIRLAYWAGTVAGAGGIPPQRQGAVAPDRG